ncbi:hypothetical protein KCP76_14805 [Salmonella enterica subsp. enterica serovar Weltevreden]|nr:hypothetical protein KCP76_14805 [Salmonella enterica subsp. enterica serovar Weltevreden]
MVLHGFCDYRTVRTHRRQVNSRSRRRRQRYRQAMTRSHPRSEPKRMCIKASVFLSTAKSFQDKNALCCSYAQPVKVR